MRIADNTRFDQVRDNLAKNRSDMSELQNQAATQKRVTKPSDDPVSAARVLASRVDLSGTNQFLKNLNYAKSFLEFTDQSLSELTENLVRAKELAISQSNDASANEESRRVVATEIQQLYNQMVAIGNRKLGDRFIFGGYKTTQQPFATDGTYNGDGGEMMIHTDKGSFIAMNLPGDRVFTGKGLGKDGIAHSITQQATSVEDLEKQRLEEKQQADDKLKRQEERKAQIRDLASLSPDEMPAALASVQEEESKGVNLFNCLKKMDTALRANDKEMVQESLEYLDQAISQVVMARAQVGSRSMTLDNVMQTLQKAKVDNQTNISQLEDADVFKTVSDINKTESTLQATLQTSGKMMQTSLMDFLR
jgi:flagellar hook-associated protein 3 FlgL